MGGGRRLAAAHGVRLFAPFLVTTDFTVADIFTKATDKGTFFKMRNYMMNVNGNLRGPLSEALSACAGASKRIIYLQNDATDLVVESS